MSSAFCLLRASSASCAVSREPHRPNPWVFTIINTAIRTHAATTPTAIPMAVMAVTEALLSCPATLPPVSGTIVPSTATCTRPTEYTPGSCRVESPVRSFAHARREAVKYSRALVGALGPNMEISLSRTLSAGDSSVLRTKLASDGSKSTFRAGIGINSVRIVKFAELSHDEGHWNDRTEV